MLFTIHINNKLDLSKFRKQAAYYFSNWLDKEISYCFYLPNYKLTANTIYSKNKVLGSGYVVEFSFSEIIKDVGQVIIKENIIYPWNDVRFTDSEIIKLLLFSNHVGIFNSNSVADVVDKICQIVTYLYKINKLKAFV